MRALLRDGLPPLPSRVAKLPIDPRGYPVPWFVSYIDGKPDFRVMDMGKFARAIRHELCWICGEPLGRWKTFVIGPMCVLTRTSAEPPTHIDCATFAATAGPFLRLPQSKRRETGLPEGHGDGIMISDNPGASMLWTTREYSRRVIGERLLFEFHGEPASAAWYAHGRVATYREARNALERGLERLRLNEAIDQPVLERNFECALAWLPQETRETN